MRYGIKAVLTLLLGLLLLTTLAACEKAPCEMHTYGEWVDITKVSCTLDGEQQRTCNVCGKTETQTIPAITHNFGEWREVSGSKIFPPIVSERVCSHCGEVETQEDMSTWWIIPAIVGGLIVGIIGVVGYIKAYK